MMHKLLRFYYVVDSFNSFMIIGVNSFMGSSSHFLFVNIEIVVTPRSSMTKEKIAISFCNNWVANRLTFNPFLMNVFLLLCYKMIYLSADLQPTLARIKSCFFLLSNCF